MAMNGFHPQRCRFPVSSLQAEEHGCLSSQMLADGLPNVVQLKGDRSYTRLLHLSWALLLRAYVRNDLVCFVRLLSPHSNSYHVKDELSHGRGIELAKYRLEGGTEALLELEPTIQQLDSRDLATKQVNSGVLELKAGSRQRHGESAVQDAEWDACMATLYRHLDIILCIGFEPEGTHLIFRSPFISEAFSTRIKSTFLDILHAVVSQQRCLPREFPTTSRADRKQMMVWNHEDPFCSRRRACMHDLIRDMTYETPDAQAICSWDGSLTYQELDALSNVVGYRLSQAGVQAGVYVPFAHEKSLWATVACLGIMKAGGAFVPLNIYDPESRLLLVLRNVAAQVVVTSQDLANRFRDVVKHVVIIDATTMAQDRLSKNTPEPTTTMTHGQNSLPNGSIHLRRSEPTDAIFVLFTSGSTGQPKGMVHDHESICSQWLAHGERLHYRNARVLQFAAHTFDVFIIDVFTALLFGGCVCIPSEEDRRCNIVGVINAMKVDHAILTPSFAGLIEPCEVPTLKTLLIGGEALPQDRIEKWAKKVTFIQIYGPAEVGICLTMGMREDSRPETVGHPLRNASCWLVDPDDSDSLVPIGAVGEMVVAGPSLAREYLNSSAKTAASFIRAPTWASDMALPFDRFYKTGDLLKFNLRALDGSYDFVGRKDSQVKLRGQRIEPGEVEYHVDQLPSVAHSVVLKPEHGPHAGELTAILEMRINETQALSDPKDAIIQLPWSPLSLETLRAHLSRHLPPYMIPTAWVQISKMPYVPSMKIDRKRLLQWLDDLKDTPYQRKIELGPLPADDATARSLSKAISNILNKVQVRRAGNSYLDRNFTLQATGIDSIQITSLAMFIKTTYHVSVSSRVLLDPETTVSSLARIIDLGIENPDGRIAANGDTSLRRSFKVMDELASLFCELKKPFTPFVPDALIRKPSTPLQDILLTGATGYLGSAILQTLLRDHQTFRVHALVRCTSPTAGLTRLIEIATQRSWWQPTYLDRLRVIPGDLSKSELDLHPDALHVVGLQAIIHAAAIVHYSTAYATLKAANVLSTLFLLKAFRTSSTCTHFTYVSGGETPNTDTIPLLASSPRYVQYLDEDTNGYTQSKVIGEALAHSCLDSEDREDQEKKVRVVKPGYIVGAVGKGEANPRDFLWRLLVGCVEVGGYPEQELRKWIFVADVDAVAEKCVEQVIYSGGDLGKTRQSRVISTDTETTARLLQGFRFDYLWETMRVDFGYKLVGMDWKDWIGKLVGKVERKGEAHLLWPLLDSLEEEAGRMGVDWVEEDDDLDNVANARTKGALKSNIRYLIEIGFLPSPSEVEEGGADG